MINLHYLKPGFYAANNMAKKLPKIFCFSKKSIRQLTDKSAPTEEDCLYSSSAGYAGEKGIPDDINVVKF